MKVLFALSMVTVILLTTALGVFAAKEDADAAYLSALPVIERQSEKKEERKDVEKIEKGEELPTLYSLSERGVYARSFAEGELPDTDDAMFALGFSSREEVLSFLSDAPLLSLDSSLGAEELGILFYLIVDFSEEAFCVQGRLESVSFLREGESLIVRADVDLSLNFLTRMFGVDILPERAEVSLLIPFCLKNSEITAYYEEMKVCFDGCTVPEMMLSFGYERTGEGNGTKRFFADAVGNVIKNACFSG